MYCRFRYFNKNNFMNGHGIKFQFGPLPMFWTSIAFDRTILKVVIRLVWVKYGTALFG